MSRATRRATGKRARRRELKGFVERCVEGYAAGCSISAIAKMTGRPEHVVFKVLETVDQKLGEIKAGEGGTLVE